MTPPRTSSILTSALFVHATERTVLLAVQTGLESVGYIVEIREYRNLARDLVLDLHTNADQHTVNVALATARDLVDRLAK